MILKQVISAVNYLHKLHIVHRDLKPENILIESISKDYIQVKLIDFGTCIDLMDEDNGMADRIGTLNYMSPEILRKSDKKVNYKGDEDGKPVEEGLNNIGMKSDMWAIGIIAYVLICGIMPFTQNRD